MSAPKADGGPYLRENREAKGMTAAQMAERLGIERESVYRLEAKADGVAAGKQAAYAKALGIQPEDLWRRPDSPSLDRRMADAPPEVQASILVLLNELLKKQ